LKALKKTLGSLKIGDRVRLRATRECGIVLLVWTNEHGDRDCYVAFYGKSFPKRAMMLRRQKRDPKRPYMLRYYDSSLERVPGDFGGSGATS
jgi:hypothetical protein